MHEELVDLLRTYYVVGGMPEAISTCAETRDLAEVRRAQDEIITAFALDFAKHTPASDIPKMRQIWASLPVQLARENKRFLFSAANEGARARDYEDALLFIRDPEGQWTASAFEEALAPYFEEYKEIDVRPIARTSEYTQVRQVSPGLFEARQGLLDPERHAEWVLDCTAELSDADADGALLRLRRIGS